MSPKTFGISAVGQPLFTPIAHPKLEQIGQKFIHTFLKEWERSLLCIQDANNAGENKVFPVSLKSAIDTDLFQSLIELEEFGEDVTSIEELNNDTLQEWLEEQQKESLDSMTLEQLEEIIRSSIQMNVKEPDPKLRAIRLFADYKMLLRTKKWEDLLTNNPKIAVGHIVEVLRPSELKIKVESDLSLSKKSLKKDWKGFFKYVVEQTTACEIFVSAYNRKDNCYKNRSTRTNSGSDSRTRSDSNPRKSAQKNEEKDKNPSKNSDKKKLPLCLNKECGERHFISNCQNVSKELASKLLKEYKKSKGNNSASDKANDQPTVKAVLQTSIDKSIAEGRIKALLADKVPVVMLMEIMELIMLH